MAVPIGSYPPPTKNHPTAGVFFVAKIVKYGNGGDTKLISMYKFKYYNYENKC